MEIIILLALIGLFSGIVKGTSGFGSSLVAVPLLALLFTTSEARTMMITANVVLNILLIYENKSYFHIDTVIKIIPLTLAGIVLTGFGIYISENIDPQIVKYIIGGLIFIAVFNKVFTINLHIKDTMLNRVIFGSLSGIGNGIASVDGPPVVLYLQSIDAKKQRFKSTLATHFLVMGIVAVMLLIGNQSYTTDVLIHTGYLVGFLITGLVIGMLISKRLNEKQFEKVVLVILIVLGVSMFL